MSLYLNVCISIYLKICISIYHIFQIYRFVHILMYRYKDRILEYLKKQNIDKYVYIYIHAYLNIFSCISEHLFKPLHI